jgi:peptide/nickel transport system permease protein
MTNERRPDGYWRILLRQFWKDRMAMAGFAVIVASFIIAGAADFIANDKPLIMKYEGRIYFPVLKDYAVRAGISRWQPPFQNLSFKEFVQSNSKDVNWVQFPPIRYSPTETDLFNARKRPSAPHFLGTDDVGRDVASRMIHGSRVSLSVGFVAVSIYVLIGLMLGAAAGYFGGILDMVVSRLIEIMLTIPTFFMVLTVVAFLQQSIFNIMIVIGVTNWPTVARLMRGECLRTKSLEYVVAARALGATDFRTIFRHVLPNTLAPIFVAATFGIASAILIESTLSFLGFGVPPSTASWGSMLYDARQLLPSAWWLTAFPGLAIFLTVTSYNLVGEGLRDAADPRLKG